MVLTVRHVRLTNFLNGGIQIVAIDKFFLPLCKLKLRLGKQAERLRQTD